MGSSGTKYHAVYTHVGDLCRTAVPQPAHTRRPLFDVIIASNATAWMTDATLVNVIKVSSAPPLGRSTLHSPTLSGRSATAPMDNTAYVNTIKVALPPLA